jgi:hypothetical protein
MADKHDERYVKQAIENAWNHFLKQDYQLLVKDVNERSITHKFAEHLKSQFPTWHIDCEYNRDGVDPKKVHLEPVEVRSDDDTGESVFPDIIVHERGTSNNLLVIEAKKDSNTSDPEAVRKDKMKLDAYKRDLGYVFGLFLKFNTGRNFGVHPAEDWV